MRSPSKLLSSNSPYTSDLNYFKEFKLQKESLIDDRFLPKQSSSANSEFVNIYGTSSASNLSSNYEVRKVLEKEIEPYMYSIKNELRLMCENFFKEIGEFKTFRTDIASLKESSAANKKLLLIQKEENEKKLSDYNNKINASNKLIEEQKQALGDYGKRVKNFEYYYDGLQEKIYQVESIKSRIEVFESNQDTLYRKLEENISAKFNNTFKENEISVNAIKEEMSPLKKSLMVQKVENETLKGEVKSFSKDLNSTKHELQNQQSLIENIYSDLTSTKKRLENSSASNEALQSNLQELKQNLFNINAKISNTFDKLESIQENIRNTNKSSISLNEKFSDLQNESRNISNFDIPDLRKQIKQLSTNDSLVQVESKLNKKFEENSKILQKEINSLKLQIENLVKIKNQPSPVENSSISNEQSKLNELFSKSLSEIVNQNKKLNEELAAVKEEVEPLDENFESVQTNFDEIEEKIAKGETATKIIQQIIQTISQNFEDFKVNTRTEFDNMFEKIKDLQQTKVAPTATKSENLNLEKFDTKIIEDKIETETKRIDKIIVHSNDISVKLDKVIEYFNAKFEETLALLSQGNQRKKSSPKEIASEQHYEMDLMTFISQKYLPPNYVVNSDRFILKGVDEKVSIQNLKNQSSDFELKSASNNLYTANRDFANPTQQFLRNEKILCNDPQDYCLIQANTIKESLNTNFNFTKNFVNMEIGMENEDITESSPRGEKDKNLNAIDFDDDILCDDENLSFSDENREYFNSKSKYFVKI